MENIYQDNGDGDLYPDIERMIPALKAEGLLSLDWEQMDTHFAEASHLTIEDRFYRVEIQEENDGYSFDAECFDLVKKEDNSGYNAHPVKSVGGIKLFSDAAKWCENHARE